MSKSRSNTEIYNLRNPNNVHVRRTAIIIITGKTALLDPQLSLEDSAIFMLFRVYVVNQSIWLSLLWISKQYIFYRERSSALHPTPNLEDMFPSDTVVQLYTQVPGYLLVNFNSQGYDGGIVTHLHAGN
jgi:hypothetical protein